MLDLLVELTQAPPLQDVGNDHHQEGHGDAQDRHRQLLTAAQGALRLFEREQIDADHLSSGRLIARPIATANSGARWRSSGGSMLRATLMRAKGWGVRTGA